MLHKSMLTTAAMAAATVTGAPVPTSVPAASSAKLQPTSVVIANLRDVDAITGDGEYLYLVGDASGSRKQGAWIEDMNGRRWAVPQVDGTAPLLGTETGGVFVLNHIAGSSPIALAFKPGVGVLPHFINHHDPFALSMYNAFLSSRGHWVATRTNAPGGGGPEITEWVDVDDTPIPMLARASDVTWSPDGVTLGYVDLRYGAEQGWLYTYNAATHRVNMIGVPFTLADRLASDLTTVALEGWQSTGSYTFAPSTAALQWSPDGKWLAGQGQSPNALHVAAIRSGRETTISLPQSSDFWGWTGSGQIFIADGQTITLYQYGRATATQPRIDRWNVVQRFTLPDTVTRVVNTPDGLLAGTATGQVYRIAGGSKALVVAKAVKAWWYDVGNGYLYVLPTAAGGRVYRVAV